MSEELPFHVVEREDRYVVVDEDNRQILASRDEHSAEHYATLLNQAYRSGYKKGYQAARHAE